MTFAAAFAAHGAGRLDEAERGYRAVLAVEPKHADAWHLLGVVAQQKGQFDAAIKHIRKALSIAGPQATYLSNLGATYEAMGRSADAVTALKKAVALDPGAFAAHFALGNALKSLGRLEEALSRYVRAEALQPQNASIHNNMGIVLQSLGRPNEAAARYRQAIALQPAHARAHYNLGVVLRDAGKLSEAADYFRKALSLQPDLAEAHINLGVVLHDQGHIEDAIAHARAAIKIEPKNAAAYSNLGAALRDFGAFDEAMESYRTALALRPTLAAARHNEGVALQSVGREDEALERFQTAQNLDSDFVEAEQNAALLMLMRGEFKAGWEAYESRWRRNLPDLGLRDFPYPRWEGQAGGGIVVWGEQGLGDRVLYASMIPDLLARGHSVVMETEPRLLTLFERSFPGVKAVAKQTPPDPATQRDDLRWHIPLASLGRWLRPDAASFPNRASYLTADAARSARYRALLDGAGKTGPVVGISWVSRNPKIGAHKTLDLRQLAPLLRIPGVRFVDLQYGDTTAERAAVEAELGMRIEHIPDLDLRADIDGVAALIAACDLVVSVSNTTVHLAAALGRPTWVMVPAASGNLWYWMRGLERSPWYSTATIFRQQKPGQWQDVIGEIEMRLKEFVARFKP